MLHPFECVTCLRFKMESSLVICTRCKLWCCHCWDVSLYPAVWRRARSGTVSYIWCLSENMSSALISYRSGSGTLLSIIGFQLMCQRLNKLLVVVHVRKQSSNWRKNKTVYVPISRIVVESLWCVVYSPITRYPSIDDSVVSQKRILWAINLAELNIFVTQIHAQTYHNMFFQEVTLPTFFCGEGPAADSTDAPQPWGLLCNPMMKIVSFFSFFRVMEHRWNEIDRGKPKYSEKNLSQCHFIHRKSHKYWPGIKPEPSLLEAALPT
jgi:hypothetical protein